MPLGTPRYHTFISAVFTQMRIYELMLAYELFVPVEPPGSGITAASLSQAMVALKCDAPVSEADAWQLVTATLHALLERCMHPVDGADGYRSIWSRLFP